MDLASGRGVFDHFNLIKLYNDKLTAYRRQLYHEVQDDQARKVIKETRWLRVSF